MHKLPRVGKGGKKSANRATSFDVAREAEVSQSTVARTFSAPHLVAEESRERVLAAAEKLGYVPNAIARSLRNHRTNLVGAVVPAHGEYWQGVLTELSLQLAQRGKQLVVSSFADVDGVERALNGVSQYRLDGLILASATIEPRQVARMVASELPIVVFNQPAISGLAPLVSVDNAAGMAALAHHVFEVGARSVVYVGGIARTSTDQLRYRGAAESLGRHGVSCEYVEAGAFTYDAGFKAASVLVDRAKLPDCIMVGSDEVAFGVIDGLRASGTSVPGDVMVTGFDGLPQASWEGYNLTTLVQPVGELISHALQILDEPTPTGVSTPLEVVVGGAVRYGATTNVASRHGRNKTSESERSNG
jgi:DNA-binding LacI/PurR family transcriptional regulator